MRRLLFLLSVLFIVGSAAFAQSPQGRKYGFGIMLGDPSGITAKIWTQPSNAWVIDLGTSYFGSPRIDVDYLWHFDAFNSRVATLYAGPGGAIGFGKGHGVYYKNDQGFYVRDNGTGLGIRGVFGVNFVPTTSPLEFFFEVGMLVGITPDFGSAVDAAIGMRFYPEF